MKFLFIHPFGIGDVIFSLAAAEALGRRGHTVDYLCNERTEGLLCLCPRVRRTHRFDRSAVRADLKAGRWTAVIGTYRKLRAELAAEKYDAAIDFSMGREYAVLAWAAGIRRRIGWDYKGRGRWLTDRVKVTGFDDRSPRDCAMDLARLADPAIEPAEMPAYPKLTSAACAAAEKWAKAKMGGAPWIVVAPGGGESWGRDAHYKQWPAASWSELTRLILEETRASVAVLGSGSEQELTVTVATAAAAHAGLPVRCVPVSGEPLDRVLALLAGARAFVGTDGGLLHLANFAGAPSVGIYGPVSERGYAPLESSAPFRTLTADVACRPCYRSFRFTGCAYEKRCLTSIPPARAAEELRSLLTSESL